MLGGLLDEYMLRTGAKQTLKCLRLPSRTKVQALALRLVSTILRKL
ncbi:MAG: hypothetical protein K2P84_05620 [Undibacterium sp.]|nr:hypothetical protein [Undibacterium sp.]